jgi:hypothetical protein
MALNITITDVKDGWKCKCGSKPVVYMEASYDDDAPCESWNFCERCLHETIDDLKDLE